jgi:radical SAM protein with 4Fe4S-binding SPASM domain
LKINNSIPISFSEKQVQACEQHILFTVMIELTYRCNLDCVFCYNDTGQGGKPLSRGQYLELLEELRSMQVLNLILTGGEPLAHPNFFEIGRRARELGFVIRIKSNGHALRGRIAERVKQEVDPYVIDVSLHGASALTHDRQTRVPGSFKRLLDNLPRLLDMGLRMKMNSTITRWNADEVEQMFAIADRIGLPLSVNTTISPKDDGDQSPFAIEATREQKVAVFRYLDGRADRAKEAAPKVIQPAVAKMAAAAKMASVSSRPPVSVNCGAGTSSLTVDPVGNVLPCVQWRIPMGNLHDATVRDMWSAQNAKVEEIRNLNRKAKQMVNSHGPDGRHLSFCPGLAHEHSGDPLALYPSAVNQMNIIKETEKLR